MEIKFLQLHKRSSYVYENIQDKYNFSLDNNSIALSDGTTQSFKSELWAKLLVDNFVKDPLFDIHSLSERFKQLARQFSDKDFEYSSNFAKASLEKAKKEKGGTATFIGIKFINDFSYQVVNCGDTCLFIIRKNEIIPVTFKGITELDNNNHFLNTNKLLENDIENNLLEFSKSTFIEDDIFLLTTDAISRLIFRKKEIIAEILECDNFESFKKFCENNWESNDLEEDDISIAIIKPILKDKILKIVPPENFTFPLLVEKEFVPTPFIPNITKPLETADMENINNQLKQLCREVNFLKSKLKLSLAILVGLFLIIILNTLLLFYYFDKKTIELKSKGSELKFNVEKTNKISPIKRNIKSTPKDTVHSIITNDKNKQDKTEIK